MRAMFAMFFLCLLTATGFAQGRDPSDRARNVERSRDATETRIDRIYEQNLQATPSPAAPAASTTVLEPARTLSAPGAAKKKKKLESPAPQRVAPANAPMRLAPR